MSKQTSKFTRAAKKAKALYKTGRYKRYSDAVSAAYKKLNSGSSTTRKKSKPKTHKRKAPRKRTAAVTHSSVNHASAAMLTRELVSRKKENLGKLLLRREMATRKTDRRKISKQVSQVKRDIRKLS